MQFYCYDLVNNTNEDTLTQYQSFIIMYSTYLICSEALV